MAKGKVKIVCWDEWGYYAEVYEDSDGGSGYGENARVGRYYTKTKAEAEEVNINRVKLYPNQA